MNKHYLAIGSIILSILFYQCVNPPNQNKNEKITDSASLNPKDTFHLICQYWELKDAEHPMTKDVTQPGGEGITLDPGIVFITDSTVLENPAGLMQYGKFSIHGKEIDVVFDNGKKAKYYVTKLHSDELGLKRIENKVTTELIYNATHTYWPDAGKNPFSKENYSWSIKPKKPESDEAIRNRVMQCTQFYSYYFTGFENGGATKIGFKSMPSCFHWYAGGISIQSESSLDKKWIDCFYSRDEALKGRQMLDDVISKKYKWDEKETDWVKQTAPVLLQIRDSLGVIPLTNSSVVQ